MKSVKPKDSLAGSPVQIGGRNVEADFGRSVRTTPRLGPPDTDARLLHNVKPRRRRAVLHGAWADRKPAMAAWSTRLGAGGRICQRSRAEHFRQVMKSRASVQRRAARGRTFSRLSKNSSANED